MSNLEQRVLEMASATSPTVGYRAKDQRREIDKRVRNLIASAYEEQRARLIRMQQTAPIAYADDLEGLNQRL
ncbi:MAG: hypothetical protein HY257_06110, partial [Chloroflexi bacterium]|nr:hypothetical protein [Chloroflexota bacterium]